MNLIANMTRPEGAPRILRSGPSSLGTSDRMAKALGWFSLALGLTQLFAPQLITKTLGMRDGDAMIRAFGAREIATGIVTLSPDKRIGLLSRILGDGIDVVALMKAGGHDNPKRDNVRLALMLVVGVMLLDAFTAQGVTVRHRRSNGIHPSYRDRTGFPRGLKSARGQAAGMKPSRTERSGSQSPVRPGRARKAGRVAQLH